MEQAASRHTWVFMSDFITTGSQAFSVAAFSATELSRPALGLGRIGLCIETHATRLLKDVHIWCNTDQSKHIIIILFITH